MSAGPVVLASALAPGALGIASPLFGLATTTGCRQPTTDKPLSSHGLAAVAVGPA